VDWHVPLKDSFRRAFQESVATCLILAIRPAHWGAEQNDVDIEYSSQLAGRVLSPSLRQNESMFPRRKKPWYQANDDDVPK
jgi:hypothetical protein